MQAVACTHCVRTLNGLRSIFSDVHAAGKNGFDFFLSAELTELCEAISARANGKDGGSLESPSLVCGDRLTNVLVSGMIRGKKRWVCRCTLPMQVLSQLLKRSQSRISTLHLTYAGIIAFLYPTPKRISTSVTPYLPRYHPNKKAKLNTSFAFCFLCFCYQNFFFLHSHKLRMTKSTLTPMTAG